LGDWKGREGMRLEGKKERKLSKKNYIVFVENYKLTFMINIF